MGSNPLIFLKKPQMGEILFYIFAFIMALSSSMVVMIQSSIYSVLFLILSFISGAFLLFLLECELLGLLFIIIYVGALTVLFLFTIMMLDAKMRTSSYDPIKYFPFGSFIGAVFLLEVLTAIFNNFKSNPYHSSFLQNNYLNWYSKLDSVTEIEVLGQTLYTHYVFQFLIVGLILFLAVVGVVILTINYKNKSSFE